MNVFSLFETKNIEDIKLGIQVVKSLNKQKEFETKMGIAFEKYEDVFNNVILVVKQDYQNKNFCKHILNNKLDLSKTHIVWIAWVLSYYPEFVNYFNLYNLKDNDVFRLLLEHPQLLHNLDLSRLTDCAISNLVYCHPKLASYFNK